MWAATPAVLASAWRPRRWTAPRDQARGRRLQPPRAAERDDQVVALMCAEHRLEAAVVPTRRADVKNSPTLFHGSLLQRAHKARSDLLGLALHRSKREIPQPADDSCAARP